MRAILLPYFITLLFNAKVLEKRGNGDEFRQKPIFRSCDGFQNPYPNDSVQNMFVSLLS